MEKSTEDFELENHYGVPGFKGRYRNRLKRRKIIRIQRPVVGETPALAVANFQGEDYFFKKLAKGVKKLAKKKLDVVKKIAKGHTKVFKKVAAVHKKVGKKVIAAHKKVGKAVVKITKKLISLPALLPLKPVMAKALKKKGVEPPKDLEKLARKFYDVIVRKKSSFEYANPDANHIAPIVAIIPPIIKFITTIIQKKKKTGSTGDPVDDSIADEAAGVIEDINAKAASEDTGIQSGNVPYAGEEDAPDTNMKGAEDMAPRGRRNAEEKGGFSFKNPIVIGVGVGAVILVIILLRK